MSSGATPIQAPFSALNSVVAVKSVSSILLIHDQDFRSIQHDVKVHIHLFGETGSYLKFPAQQMAKDHGLHIDSYLLKHGIGELFFKVLPGDRPAQVV